MIWVRRIEPASRHCCVLPYTSGFPMADGAVGDLWRCEACRMLWRVVVSHDTGLIEIRDWRRATWWQRWRYRNQPGDATEQGGCP
ncbi:hypothetical protein HNP84_007342 [Thermocatellispora tengchongensis]|uniref:Uncharacterized protein n=1 Tax=Thermocatellispora tengchongensis TaxID=1073253 RepID=A0A840PJ51_9ACTN|nr:hypothetical protein [Thermocatellispora tengchongensis]MBB5137590.1 hypothetical protein [Thermocatellispora tengchongensis]